MPRTIEIVVIALVVLALFGASAIPKFAKSLGQAKKEFKKASDEEDEKDSKKVDTKESEKVEEKK